MHADGSCVWTNYIYTVNWRVITSIWPQKQIYMKYYVTDDILLSEARQYREYIYRQPSHIQTGLTDLDILK